MTSMIKIEHLKKSFYDNEVLKDIGRKTFMPQCGGGFDKGVAKDMGHLGSEGNHFVVIFSGSDRKTAKTTGSKGLLAPIQQLHIVKSGWNQHHGLTLK